MCFIFQLWTTLHALGVSIEEKTISLYRRGVRRLDNPYGTCGLGWVGAQPLIVKPKLGIVLKVEFQTSFWHSKINFFQKTLNYRKVVYLFKFHLQKSVWHLETPIKSYAKKMFFKMSILFNKIGAWALFHDIWTYGGKVMKFWSSMN